MKFAFSNFEIVIIQHSGVRTVGLDHPFYVEICKALQTGDDEKAVSLLDAKKTMEDQFNKVAPGSCEVKDNETDPTANPDIYMDGVKITGRVAEMIMRFKQLGLPFTALKNFWKKVQSNPLLVGKESMLDFMTHNNVPLLPDGRFIAYKGVVKTENPTVFTSAHDREFKYTLGVMANLEREKCTVDVENACGPGLHVGGFNHACGYGNTILDCIVDPADVTSVPKAENCKLRACRVLPWRVNNERKPYEGEFVALERGEIVNKGVVVPLTVEKASKSAAKPSGGRTKKTTWYRLVGGKVVSQRKVKRPGSEWTAKRPVTHLQKQAKGKKPAKVVSKPVQRLSLKGAAKVRTWYRLRQDQTLDRVRAVTKPAGYTSHKPTLS